MTCPSIQRITHRNSYLAGADVVVKLAFKQGTHSLSVTTSDRYHESQID